MEPAYDVIGIGVCACDLVIEVGRYLGPDEKALYTMPLGFPAK